MMTLVRPGQFPYTPKMMIKYIFKELGVRGTDSSFVSKWEPVADSCEHGNETSSSMKDEFCD
jgi:hypothetical protein